MRYFRWVTLCVLALALVGCSIEWEFDFPTPNGPVTAGFATRDVTLAAGMTELQPAPSDTLTPTINLSRLSVNSLQRVYELETPAGTDFAFSVVARGNGNVGLTRVSVAHAAANGLTPNTGVESIATNGMTLEGAGMNYRGDWLDVTGDGFSRVTIRGNISSSQSLVLSVPRANDTINIGVRISIGNQSAINVIVPGLAGAPPGMSMQTIYSSDSWQFGLPAIAVSGDRYSIATYDGDASQSSYVTRKRQWLQYDALTSTVSGGNADCPSYDAGFWRDQEIAALGNVLAVVYTGNGEVRADISLDRGATFPIQQPINIGACWGQRLVQAALSGNYTLGCLFWRTVGSSSSPRSELVLVEATPTAFDINNTPIGYAWGAPRIIHDAGDDVTPLLMHMTYSSGGDLAIGYGYTIVTPGAGWTVTSSSRFRCAVRQFGQTVFLDQELDREDFTMPADPHVAVLGSGPTMEIFYSYEKTDGIHMLYSSNAGLSFTQGAFSPEPGAVMPSVCARMQGAQKRVDLLYCAQAAMGMEIHCVHWDDFGVSTPSLYQVTQCTVVPASAPAYPGLPNGVDITSVDWFGYDAVVKGDDVAVVVHERTYNCYEYFGMWGGTFGAPLAGASGGGGGGSAATAPPPVLLPGMTGTVAAPNSAHRNQLKLITLD